MIPAKKMEHHIKELTLPGTREADERILQAALHTFDQVVSLTVTDGGILEKLPIQCDTAFRILSHSPQSWLQKVTFDVKLKPNIKIRRIHGYRRKDFRRAV